MSIILDKTPCLFTKEIIRENHVYQCLSRKNSKVGSCSYTEGEKIGLPEGNLARVSSKHNEYQVSFI